MPIFGRWQTKPPPGTQVDWNHPLTRGLVGCWPINEGCGSVVHNLATSQKVNNGTLTGTTGLPTWTGSPSGGGLTMVGANSQYVNCGNVAELSGSRQASMFVLGYRDTVSTSLFSCGRATTTYSPFWIYQASGIYTYFGVASAGQYSTPYALSPATLGNFSATLVYDSINQTGWPEVAGYINGAPKTLSTSGSIPVQAGLTTLTDNFTFGQNTWESKYTTGQHDLVLLWCARALSAAEVANLSLNPWQIFVPQSYSWLVYRSTSFSPWLYNSDDC